MTATADMTIRDLVAADYRAAAIFDRHGVDFCCGGRQTVAEGCRGAGADAEALLRDLEQVTASQPAGTARFNDWDLGRLAAHIVTNHHAYVRQALPTLRAHSRKIADVHGARHPELARVAQLVEDVAEEMTAHMMKEEQVLFPYIASLAAAAEAGRPAPAAPFGSVQNPIRMMEAEHESAGRATSEIRRLTSGYRPPTDGCETYRVCLAEMEAFEADLHTHVHLENNILFPKAALLEAAGR